MKFVPSVGRIVHYVIGGSHKAAIITAVHSDEYVNLFVFPSGDPVTDCRLLSSDQRTILFTTPEDARDFTCHWPERAEAK